MKHFNLILMFTVLMSMIGAKTFAYDIEVANAEGVTIYYNSINDGIELEVTYKTKGYNSYSGVVAIPEDVTYDNKTLKVTSIGYNAFYDCSDLTSVTIPNSVTIIKWGAFEKCRNLASITIPNGVASIDCYAFDGTAWFDNQPDGLVYAGKVAYKYKGTMPENTSIVLDEGTLGIAGYAFSNEWSNSSLISIEIPNSVTNIGFCAFYNCSGLTSITIPNSIAKIEYGTFEYCKNLTSITIPNSVESIDYYAFNGTAWYDNQPDGLVYAGKVAYKYKGTIPENTSIVIEEGTLGIASGAFSNDGDISSSIGLVSINIPNSVTNIGSSAFSGCRGLTSIEIPNSVTSIREYTFTHCSSLISITIPNSITSIGHEAFWDCIGLTSITIPGSVTSIGDGAFAGCSGLTAILVDESNQVYDSRDNCNAIIHTSDNVIISGCMNSFIPNSVSSINKYAFYGCNGLTSITIPNSVTSIGNSAFSGSGLTSITIPNSVTSIGSEAFRSCSSLTSAIIGNNVNSIKWGTFYECTNLTSVTIPSSVTSIDDYAFYLCQGLTSITIPNSVTNIGEYAFGLCTGITSLKISNGVMSLGDYAFWLCTKLTSITIPKSVTSIGNSAFDTCINLTSITISTSVSNIGHYAFKSCTSLTSISIPNSVTSIGEGVFSNCSSLTSITIPNSVTSIGEYAFSGCSSLTSITIPNNVSNIGNYAFHNCSSLISVTIKNETPINIKSGAFPNRANAILYVPKGTKTVYAAANYWKDFKEIVEISPNMGDANGDGVVNVADVVEAVNTMNGKASAKFKFSNADLNQNGKIDQTDIDIIVNLIYSNIPKLDIPEPVPVPTQGDRNAVGSGGGPVITQGVHVENAQWEEMGNGAMRLTAKLNGQGYKVSAYIGKTYIPRLGRLYSQCGNIPFP